MLSQGAAENRNNEICHIIYILHMCMCVQRWVAQSCLTLCDPVDCSLPGSSVRGDSPGKNTGAGCHAPLQGIFPTQRSNPGLRIAGGFFTVWTTREAQESWSGLPIPSPGDLPDPGIEPGSPALQVDALFYQLSYPESYLGNSYIYICIVRGGGEE